MTVRPTRSGRAVAAPCGRLRYAHTPPRLSASDMRAPPWSAPPVVQSSSRQARRPTTSSALADTSSIPSVVANGIIAPRAASGGAEPGSVGGTPLAYFRPCRLGIGVLQPSVGETLPAEPDSPPDLKRRRRGPEPRK